MKSLIIIHKLVPFQHKTVHFIVSLLLLCAVVMWPKESEADCTFHSDKLHLSDFSYPSKYKSEETKASIQTRLFSSDLNLASLNVLKTSLSKIKKTEVYRTTESLISESGSSANQEPLTNAAVPVPINPNSNASIADSLSTYNANGTTLLTTLLDSLQKVWSFAQESFITPPAYKPDIKDIENFFKSEKLTIDNYSQLNKAYLEAKLRSLRGDIGLNAALNYSENFSNQAIDADNFLYRRKVSVGLDWNILNNGLVESLFERKALANEALLSEMEGKTSLKNSSYLTLYNRIIYFFNIKKLEILDRREKIMNMKFPIALALLNLQQIPKITIVKMERQKADLEGLKMLYSSYNSLNQDLIYQDSNEVLDLPYFDFNVTAIQNNISQVEDKNIEIENILANNIRYESSALTKINLSLKFNYNLYDYNQSAINQRSFYSIGLAASAPLSLAFDNSKKVLNTQLAMQTANAEEDIRRVQEEDIKSIYALKYKQKDYLNYVYKLNYYQELLRIQRVRSLFKDADYKPLDALDEIDAYLSTKVEQIDILEDMYLSLLAYYRQHPQVALTDYVQASSPPQISSEVSNTLSKSIYIWSEAYKQYSPSYIDEILSQNHFSNAIVSLPLDKEKRVLAIQLIKELQMQGKRIELMVGDHSFLEKDSLAQRLHTQLEGINLKTISALHLDVEPHTMKDWSTNKEVLTEKYIKLLEQASIFCDQNQISLSVSIPLSYEDSLLKSVYKYAQHVYLMAYEHKDVSYIQRKTELPMSYGKEKTSVCIRVKDFESIGELNNFTQELIRTMHLDNIVIHDLSDFIYLNGGLKFK